MMISFLFWLVDDPDILIRFECPICFYDHVAGFCWFSGLSFSHFCWGVVALLVVVWVWLLVKSLKRKLEISKTWTRYRMAITGNVGYLVFVWWVWFMCWCGLF